MKLTRYLAGPLAALIATASGCSTGADYVTVRSGSGKQASLAHVNYPYPVHVLGVQDDSDHNHRLMLLGDEKVAKVCGTPIDAYNLDKNGNGLIDDRSELVIVSRRNSQEFGVSIGRATEVYNVSEFGEWPASITAEKGPTPGSQTFCLLFPSGKKVPAFRDLRLEPQK
jgi:hypothetical protein